MPDGLTTFGSNGTGAVSEFLRDIQKIQADQTKFEDTLQRLKISNVERLGTMQKQQQQRLLNESIAAQQQVITKEYERKRAAQRKYDAQRLKDEAKYDEETFKKHYGMSKKQAAEESKRRKAQLVDEEKLRLKTIEKEGKAALKNKKKEAAAEKAAEQKQDRENLLGKGKSLSERWSALKKMGTADVFDENGNKVGRKFSGAALFANLTNALGDLAKQLDSKIDQVASYKSAIDTRLQGSKNAKNWAGSYWEKMSSDITGIAGISPLIKQSAVAERVSSMVSQGIAFNVEQRAVLQELAGKIATTFNAADGTLLRLIRIQQQDTTAGRLGMESALTAFLNNMYETTEYMQSIATQVKASLNEAMSLMTGENALSFEYQVQKWLGSMYSVGMSDSAVQGLGGVLGKLASGQLDAITQGGQGNLVVMAANQAGLSIGDILNNGLNAQTTNDLMNAMVDYLAKIYQEAGDSKVIQQQMANVYGMTASDLKAAVNLAKSAGVVSRDGLTYASAVGRLNTMANSMYSRTSIGEMMTNAWDNFQYTMAAGIANNPALYAMYKAAGLLDTVAGGLEFSLPTVMGTGMAAQTFNVANILRAGALGGSILGGIGSMIASGGNGGITGSGILRAAGIGSGITTVTRGTGAGLSTAGGATLSESGTIAGNANGGDVSSKSMAETTDSAKASTANAVDDSEETKLKDVRSDVIDIYNLIQSIANGMYTIKVDVQNDELVVKQNL